AGGADALVTSDRHLLTLDPCGTVRIVRPAAFVRLWRLGMLAPPRAGRPRRAEAVSAFPLTGAPAGLGWRRSRPQPGASGRPAGQRSRDDLARPKGPTSGRPAPGGVRAAPGLTPA
ncbi:MAG TPA: hypothetical protein VFE78_00270, partial [Gemmataceae bacterium]|nr:hypothetical protein [Gemmataceae bacterium]